MSARLGQFVQQQKKLEATKRGFWGECHESQGRDGKQMNSFKRSIHNRSIINRIHRRQETFLGHVVM